MGGINRANLRKTLYYLKRNGLADTWYAAKERLEESKAEPYRYQPPTEQELERQRQESEGQIRWQELKGQGQEPEGQGQESEDQGREPEGQGQKSEGQELKGQGQESESQIRRPEPGKRNAFQGTVSIVVPMYHTKERYLRELIESVLAQTFPRWELVLADASEETHLHAVVQEYADTRIRYISLRENAGIAENTNHAMAYATGDYIGLLDHDDLLTADALYEMSLGIARGGLMLYSDEDKCNEDATEFYEPNLKEKFNLDLLLSNNYICHFLVMESSLMKELGLRQAYDGAQDYDLILRGAECLMEREEQIIHIPRVLYHWRCHRGSTAENPRSKQYAYEAGRRAVQAFVDRLRWNAEVEGMKHLGFYSLSYPAGPLHDRTDLGAMGGRILSRGRTVGGRMTEDGRVFYEGLPAAYSGYLHRAVLPQDADAVDIRCIRVREECIPIFEEITGVTYRELPGTAIFDASGLPPDMNCQRVSIALGKAIREAGYRILYQPAMKVTQKENRT